MIRGASENFCTLRVHRGGAQGADLGGSEGVKYSSESCAFLVPIQLHNPANFIIQNTFQITQTVAGYEKIILSIHFMAFLTNQETLKFSYSRVSLCYYC